MNVETSGGSDIHYMKMNMNSAAPQLEADEVVRVGASVHVAITHGNVSLCGGRYGLVRWNFGLCVGVIGILIFCLKRQGKNKSEPKKELWSRI